MNRKGLGVQKNTFINILEKAAKFAIYNRNFISTISTSPLYNDEPKLFSYSGAYKTRFRENQKYDYASGVSFNKNRALMRVLGEGLERYCLDNFRPSVIFSSTVDKLRHFHLNPKEVSPFTEDQLRHSSFKKFRLNDRSSFNWTKGFSLTHNRQVLIPTQLISFAYDYLPHEPTIIPPISTGVAAGSSLQDVLLRAIYEAIERDSYMISYLNKLQSPKIRMDSINNKEIKKILSVFGRYRLELTVLDLTTDIKIPSFAALTIDATRLGPAVSIGLKAGFHYIESIIGAIEESLMTRAWIRDKFIYEQPHYRRKKDIIDIEDRAYFWFPVEMINHLDFWLKSENSKSISKQELKLESQDLERVISLLSEREMEILYVDITDPKIRKYGFRVVRVIIPQLQPVYLDERYPYLGKKRLYGVPVKMGFIQSPKKISQLNKIPHPFL